METKQKNLELWNKVEKTNPAYTKKANVKGNKITSISPQYQIKSVTEQFGTYGNTWGFKNIQLGYELLCYDLITFKATFFYPNGEFEIINSIQVFMNKDKTMIDDNFAKKIETDALTKAISKLGFNADVFMGKFDDVRYISELEKEFKEKPKATTENIQAVKTAMDKADNKKVVLEKASNYYSLTKEQLDELEMYSDL